MNNKALLDAEFFPHVIRPARYIGNEWGAVRPRSEAVAVRLALCVPEKYDRAMGYAELHRVYVALNSSTTISCERAFIPDNDAAALLRQKSIPLFTLESFTPLGDCDWIHFLIPDALSYNGMLSALKLAHIPLRASERNASHPIITASGIKRLNPEPIAEFLDAFVVGDLDAEAASIAAVVSQGSVYDRPTMLNQLSQIAGIYLPALSSQNNPVRARRVDSAQKLRNIAPVMAFEEVANDRLCVTLPSSFDVPRLVDAIVTAQQETGYDEIALSANLTIGIKNFDQFINSLGQRLRDRHVAIVLPPLPVNQHALDYVRAVTYGEKQGLRFDLKSGSERLREAHGHFTAFEQFYQILANAFSGGWKSVRLDFQLGLPEETDRDISDMIDVIRNCESVRREYGDKTHLVISLSPFAPLPFSEWQWDAAINPDEYKRRCDMVQRGARGRNIQYKIREAESAYLLSSLSRADRSFTSAVIAMSEIEASTENFGEDRNLENWRQTLTASGIDIEESVSARPLGSPLPWDHIEYDTAREQLLRSRQNAFPASESRKTSGGFKLGDLILSKPELAEQILTPVQAAPTGSFGRRPKRVLSEPAPMIVPRSRIRLQWTKDESVRYVGHLATMRMFERAIRRANMPVAYSQGYHQRPKLSFGPPLSLGYSSRCEFLDIQLDTPFQESMIDRLNEVLPEGFHVLLGKPVFGKAASVSSLINLACYEVQIGPEIAISDEKTFAVLAQPSILVRRIKNEEINEIDVRNSILNIELRQGMGVHHLYMELALGNRGFVRPDEILSTCFGLSSQEILPLKICRTALMVSTGGSRLSPFEVSS
ncbi:MAG: DUF2344 domain-containing protein [bacterium]|nr:DUF2344 domain-containing protein [bacterium]